MSDIILNMAELNIRYLCQGPTDKQPTPVQEGEARGCASCTQSQQFLSRGFGDYREHRDGPINSHRRCFPLAWTLLNTRDLTFRACHFALHLPEKPVLDSSCQAPAELCYHFPFMTFTGILSPHAPAPRPRYHNTGSNVLSGKHSGSN